MGVYWCLLCPKLAGCCRATNSAAADAAAFRNEGMDPSALHLHRIIVLFIALFGLHSSIEAVGQ